MAMAEECTQSPSHLGDPSYLTHLSSSLNQLRQQGLYCDITIIVGNKRFPAHKAVLSCASRYFETMFTSAFQESSSSEVTVPGTSESFAQLIQFAYTGFFTLSTTTVAGILNVACYMHFTQAVQVCARYLSDKKDKLSIDHCFEIWFVADNFGSSLSELAVTFSRHLVRNFRKCLESQNFLEHATVDFLLRTCLENEEIETEVSTELQVGVNMWCNWHPFNVLPWNFKGASWSARRYNVVKKRSDFPF